MWLPPRIGKMRILVVFGVLFLRRPSLYYILRNPLLITNTEDLPQKSFRTSLQSALVPGCRLKNSCGVRFIAGRIHSAQSSKLSDAVRSEAVVAAPPFAATHCIWPRPNSGAACSSPTFHASAGYMTAQSLLVVGNHDAAQPMRVPRCRRPTDVVPIVFYGAAASAYASTAIRPLLTGSLVLIVHLPTPPARRSFVVIAVIMSLGFTVRDGDSPPRCPTAFINDDCAAHTNWKASTIWVHKDKEGFIGRELCNHAATSTSHMTPMCKGHGTTMRIGSDTIRFARDQIPRFTLRIQDASIGSPSVAGAPRAEACASRSSANLSQRTTMI
ncbi:hypothetical protein AB1N83_006519 [Pleurotus pulmonarius]